MPPKKKINYKSSDDEFEEIDSNKQAKHITGVHPRTLMCTPKNTWMGYTFYWVPTARFNSDLLYSTSTGEELNALVTKLSANAALAEVDGQMLEVWERGERYRKAQMERDIKTQRRVKIESYMKELGYAEEEFKAYDWTSHTQIDKAKELTPQDWKKIQKPLIDLLNSLRTENIIAENLRQQSIRMNNLRPFYDQLVASQSTEYERATFLPFQQFLELESVKVLHSVDTLTLNEEEKKLLFINTTPKILIKVQEKRIQHEISTFTRLSKAYAKVEAALSSNSTETSTSKQFNTDDMKLLSTYATSSFPCTSYGHKDFSSHYPAILNHIKSVEDCSGFDDEFTLQTSPLRIKCIKAILELVNLPLDTTVETLNQLGEIFLCEVCSTSVILQNWSSIVYHTSLHSSSGITSSNIKIRPLVVPEEGETALPTSTSSTLLS